MLEFENADSVRLSQFHHTIALSIVEVFGQRFRKAVDDEVQGPVKHLDKEWKLLKKLAVVVVAKAVSVGRFDGATATVPSFAIRVAATVAVY